MVHSDDFLVETRRQVQVRTRRMGESVDLPLNASFWMLVLHITVQQSTSQKHKVPFPNDRMRNDKKQTDANNKHTHASKHEHTKDWRTE